MQNCLFRDVVYHACIIYRMFVSHWCCRWYKWSQVINFNINVVPSNKFSLLIVVEKKGQIVLQYNTPVVYCYWFKEERFPFIIVRDISFLWTQLAGCCTCWDQFSPITLFSLLLGQVSKEFPHHRQTVMLANGLTYLFLT